MTSTALVEVPFWLQTIQHRPQAIGVNKFGIVRINQAFDARQAAQVGQSLFRTQDEGYLRAYFGYYGSVGHNRYRDGVGLSRPAAAWVNQVVQGLTVTPPAPSGYR